MIPVEVLGFALIALLSFSLASASIKALQVACIAFKWLVVISALVFSSNAGRGKLEFLPNTN